MMNVGMIISHKHRFIFIKIEKTAGTSIEIALSRYCGPDDIITPVSPEDETLRQELGGRGPQNYIIPVGAYSAKDWVSLASRMRLPAFVNHASAAFIRDHIDHAVWDSYFKFCFERNPWDKIVSYYYWENRKRDLPSISEFIRSGRASRLRGRGLYTIDGEVAVDKIYLFERIADEMTDIARVLGLPEVPVLPRAKSCYRKDRRHYRELISPQDRDWISKAYACEIDSFSYEW